jgi:hypothetical protein
MGGTSLDVHSEVLEGYLVFDFGSVPKRETRIDESDTQH